MAMECNLCLVLSDLLNHVYLFIENFTENTSKPLLILYTIIAIKSTSYISQILFNPYTPIPLTVRAKHFFFNIALKIPFVGAKIRAELTVAGDDLRESISFNPRTQDSLPPDVQKQIASYKSTTDYKREVPDVGRSNSEIIKELTDLKLAYDDNLTNAKCGNLQMYYNDSDLLALHIETYKMFMKSNMLHADHFKAARKLEAEVCRQVLGLYNGGPETAAVHTTGGTESILLSMLAWRNHWAENHNFNGVCPELILSTTAHPAFDRACSYSAFKTPLETPPGNAF